VVLELPFRNGFCIWDAKAKSTVVTEAA